MLVPSGDLNFESHTVSRDPPYAEERLSKALAVRTPGMEV